MKKPGRTAWRKKERNECVAVERKMVERYGERPGQIKKNVGRKLGM